MSEVARMPGVQAANGFRKEVASFVRRWRCIVLCVGLALVALSSEAAVVVRESLEPGIYATVKYGRIISLECHPQQGDGRSYLADPALWKRYENSSAVAVPFEQLSDAAKRKVLLTVFPEDFIDERGWTHTVRFADDEGQETVWALAEWLTGNGTNHRKLEIPRDFPQRGAQLFIPRELLLQELREPTRSSLSFVEPKVESVGTTGGGGSSELSYGSDGSGRYAAYRLKQGEALYSAVVVRFTDFRDNQDILDACEIIRRRSGIKDVRDMHPGQVVLIPMDMLSDRYLPKDSELRQDYERRIEEAQRYRAQRVQTRNLEGVVVVLDPGHGGQDQGAAKAYYGLYEDEINYDIVCRIKKILEETTAARVYVTTIDRSLGYKAVDRTRFVHDEDEELRTTPHFTNLDGNKTSLNLRWMLANQIYDHELSQGTDARKIVFTSIHTDWLYNEAMRGAMVYIPGAKNRRSEEAPSGSAYNSCVEGRNQRVFQCSASDRTRDEAMSRNFASTFLDCLGRHDPPIQRHKEGDPIRAQIRRGGGEYVPVVIRNNKIPTKVLIETANLANSTDQRHLSNPKWRQWFAEAYVDALLEYFS